MTLHWTNCISSARSPSHSRSPRSRSQEYERRRERDRQRERDESLREEEEYEERIRGRRQRERDKAYREVRLMASASKVIATQCSWFFLDRSLIVRSLVAIQ